MSVVRYYSYSKPLIQNSDHYLPASLAGWLYIPTLYEQTKVKIKDNLGKAYYISVTTDAWNCL